MTPLSACGADGGFSPGVDQVGYAGYSRSEATHQASRFGQPKAIPRGPSGCDSTNRVRQGRWVATASRRGNAAVVPPAAA